MNHRIKMFLRNFKKCGKMFWIHKYRFIRWPIRINIQDNQLPHRDTSNHFSLKIDDALNNPIDLFTSLNLTILVWCLRAGFHFSFSTGNDQCFTEALEVVIHVSVYFQTPEYFFNKIWSVRKKYAIPSVLHSCYRGG